MFLVNRKTGNRATAIVMVGRVRVDGMSRQLPPGTAIVDDESARRFMGPIELRDKYALIVPTEHFRDHDGFNGGPDLRCATNRKGQPRARRRA